VHDRELHVGRCEIVLRQHGAREQIRQRARSRNSERLALQFGRAVDARLGIDGVCQTRPIATKEFNVGAARGSNQGRSRVAFVTVELASKQRLERQSIALELLNLDLQTLLLGKAASAAHEDNAGVALGLDDTVAPEFQFLCARGEDDESRQCCQGQYPLTSVLLRPHDQLSVIC